jgi:hypothetical protein
MRDLDSEIDGLPTGSDWDEMFAALQDNHHIAKRRKTLVAPELDMSMEM